MVALDHNSIRRTALVFPELGVLGATALVRNDPIWNQALSAVRETRLGQTDLLWIWALGVDSFCWRPAVDACVRPKKWAVWRCL
jgi:hypothetical protein